MTSKRYALMLPVLCIVVALSSCTMWSEKKHANWKSATSGENLANLFWKDVKAKDWQSLDGHVAPQFTGIIRSGITNHDQLMQNLKGLDLQDFQIGELQTQLHGGDLVVIYSVTLKGTSKGEPLPSTPIRILSVWQELKHGWVLVAQSAGMS